MNQVKLNELIKSKIINIPLYVLKMYKEFNLTTSEMVLLFFLYDKDGEIFDPSFISQNLNIELMEVMEIVSNLTDHGLLNVVTKENSDGIKEEVIDLSPFFDKIALKLMSEFNTTLENDINVYSIIEEEFNRKLTPLECEMVDDWKKNNYSNELIKEATREASLNGVTSLRYIDKILYEWDRRGYKKKEDIKKNTNTKEQVEIYNCDWLDIDDEI